MPAGRAYLRNTGAIAAAVFLMTGVAALVGCRQLGSAMYFFQPRQWQEAEFEFEGGKLAVLIEAARSDMSHPVFSFSLQEKIAEVFRMEKVKVEVIAYDRLQAIRQSNPDFDRWSIQRVGREANVNFVLYLRLNDLKLTESPDAPLVTPAVDLTARLIGVDEPDDAAVLWPKSPQEREGRRVQAHRPPVERTGAETVDREARRLGYETGREVAKFFYKYDAEERPIREP